LPQLRGRVAVHAEQVDDAAAEARGEALLPRHLLQGEPHSTPHKTVHSHNPNATDPTANGLQVRFDGSPISQLPLIARRLHMEYCSRDGRRGLTLSLTLLSRFQVELLCWSSGRDEGTPSYALFKLLLELSRSLKVKDIGSGRNHWSVETRVQCSV